MTISHLFQRTNENHHNAIYASVWKVTQSKLQHIRNTFTSKQGRNDTDIVKESKLLTVGSTKHEIHESNSTTSHLPSNAIPIETQTTTPTPIQGINLFQSLFRNYMIKKKNEELNQYKAFLNPYTPNHPNFSTRQNQLNTNAIILQCQWRSFQSHQLRQTYHQERMEQEYIQREIIRQHDQFILDTHAIRIQYVFLMNLAKKKCQSLREEKLRQEQCCYCMLIQSHIRRFLARRRFRQLQQSIYSKRYNEDVLSKSYEFEYDYGRSHHQNWNISHGVHSHPTSHDGRIIPTNHYSHTNTQSRTGQLHTQPTKPRYIPQRLHRHRMMRSHRTNDDHQHSQNSPWQKKWDAQSNSFVYINAINGKKYGGSLTK